MKDALLTLLLLLSLAFGVASPALAQSTANPYARPAPKNKFEVRKNVMVPMRDGVRLATDIYTPSGAGERLPVILIRVPYNKDTYRGATIPAEFFAGQGYVVLVQDVRGKHASEGEYAVQMADARDGYDAVEWAAKQPWSTGKIGTYGCSYLGEVQFLLAKMRHPNHIAMIPQSASGALGPAGGHYTNFGFNFGGATLLSSAFGWFGVAGSKVKGAKGPDSIDFQSLLRSLPTAEMDKRAGYPPTDFRDFFTHPPADPYWEQMHYLRDDDRFDTPALHVNSWLDVTPEQTLYAFNLMRRRAVSARARDNQFVIISPTVHCASEAAREQTKVGDRDFGDARLAYWKLYLDWFDYWLKGVENGVKNRPKAQYYLMGKNEWRTSPVWPPAEMRAIPFYLSSKAGAATSAGDGLLAVTKPVGSGRDRFTYDPADPLPSRGGGICCTGNPTDVPGVFDQSILESRRDLLVYSTPLLDRGVTIAGPVRLVLYVSSDARDTDFTAKLIDVDEQGRAWNVSNGILRARYRDGMTKSVLMERDRVYRVEVSLNSTAHYFAPGHRIRLHVSSSDFPMYDRNLNTGGDNVTETNWVKANNTIHFGARNPSQLLLPVVP
jgi:putative CocE/NonD family hydrolase